MTTIPARLIEERGHLSRSYALWQSGGLDNLLSDIAPKDDKILLDSPFLATRFLGDAELVWIARDMVDLIRHAATTLPVYPWSRSHLPFLHSLCVCEKPLIVVPHTADAPVSCGIELSVFHWLAQDDSRNCLTVAWHYLRSVHQVPVPCMVYVLKEGQVIPEHRIDHTLEASAAAHLPQLLAALWLLLRQKVAVRRKVSADRATRRRAMKEGVTIPSEFTIIELRRPLNASEAAPVEGGPRDWSHRWIVDGHWRNQYHPSDESHVPTWIAPYVKGPDDKPLVVKQRIHSWVR